MAAGVPVDADASTLYDATTGGSLVAADGAVARWEDKSGNARHVTQSTGTFQPLRKTAIKNSRDVVRFDGANDYMVAATATDWAFLHESQSTTFIVFRAGDVADPETPYALIGTSGSVLSPGGANFLHDTRSAASQNDSLRHVVGYGSPRTINDAQNTIPGNQYAIFSIVSKPSQATPADRSEMYVNGGAAVKGNTQTGTYGTGTPRHALTVGSVQDSSNIYASFLVGDIAEVLMFNSALSSANLGAVRGYLNTKWGIY